MTFLAFILLPIGIKTLKTLYICKKKKTTKSTSTNQFSDIDRDGTPEINASLAPATTPE